MFVYDGFFFIAVVVNGILKIEPFILVFDEFEFLEKNFLRCMYLMSLSYLLYDRNRIGPSLWS